VKLTRLLLGFGLEDFSMQAAQVLSVKERVLMASVKKSRKAATQVLNAFEMAEIARLIRELNERRF
jgi:phosphotransferase system enzyme I (PtsI)